MEINSKDLGKIVDLSLKPDWGPGIISKMDLRFAYIIFQNAEDGLAKKYFLTENPLRLSANQDEPALVKRARAKNRKIKVKKVVPAVSPNTATVTSHQDESAPKKSRKLKVKETVPPAAAV